MKNTLTRDLSQLFALSMGAAVVGLLLFAEAAPVYACSCAPLATDEFVEGADLIVVGRVQRLIRDLEESRYPDVDAVVAVERYLKGDGPVYITADDPEAGGACGFFYEASVGQLYLLFLRDEAAWGKPWTFRTGLCSGSRSLDRPAAQEFLQDVEAITGLGSLPQSGVIPSWWDPVWLSFGIAVGAAVALIVASALLIRRRRTGKNWNKATRD